MRVLLLILAVVMSSAELRADRLVASSTDFGSVGDSDVLYIHRIGESSISELHHEPVTSKPELVWSDARTLWVLTETIAPYTAMLQKFVDGKEVSKSSLGPKDWNATAVITPVLLRVSRTGEVWIETCVTGTPSPAMGVNPVCKATGYLRVDAKPFELASKRPAFRESRPASTRGKAALGGHLVATFRARSLDDMRNDPKPYDGLWKLDDGKHAIGEIPGQQLLIAPAAGGP
jgi:hypothetical protein